MFLLAFFLLGISQSFAQSKENVWEVGIRNSWINRNASINTGYSLGAFVNHQMTIFDNSNWLLINELGYEKLITESDPNQPLFWYQNALRYRIVIARKFNYLSHQFFAGLGPSFMYGKQLMGGVRINGEFFNPNYQRELSYGPSISLSYKNKVVSDRLGVRFDFEVLEQNRVVGFSLLYSIK